MLSAAYRYFYAIAQELSIRKAAERVHISASAMSRQLALLEEELGQPLLERRSRGMVLTEAGRLLKEHVRKLMLQEQELRASMADVAGLKIGHVRLALGNGFATSVGALVLPRFAGTHPGLTYSFVVASSDDILRAVDEERVDLGLTFDSPPHPTVEVIDSFPAPLCLLVDPAHALARRHSAVGLETLQTLPLALLGPSHRIRQLLSDVELDEGFRLQPVLESNSYDILRSFVQARLGATVLPRLAVMQELQGRKLVALPVRHRLLEGSTGSIIKRKGRKLPVASAQLAALIREQIAR